MVKPLITTNVRWNPDQMSGPILNTFHGSRLILTMPCEASDEKPRVGGYKDRKLRVRCKFRQLYSKACGHNLSWLSLYSIIFPVYLPGYKESVCLISSDQITESKITLSFLAIFLKTGSMIISFYSPKFSFP